LNSAEKTFILVMVVGMSVFVYYFFIVTPKPEYDKVNDTIPYPSNARYDYVKKKFIVGVERPSAVLVIPPVLFFYFVLFIVTDNGNYRLREIIDVKDFFRNVFRK